MIRRLLAFVATAALLALAFAGPSTAQTTQPDDIDLIDPESVWVDGVNPHYEQLDTPLGSRHDITDVLTPDDPWLLWDGTPTEVFDLDNQTPENYDSEHNHYQSFMVDLTNTVPDSNGVPIWGNGSAITSGAGAWGGFFSARSSCSALLSANIPPDVPVAETVPGTWHCPPDFDAQLIGLEVDVLNGGKPGVFGNKAKHGIQVVGFGNPNGHGISMIAHGFDRPEGEQNGQFEAGFYLQKAIHPDYGRVFVVDQERAFLGLDMDQTVFAGGAVLLRTEDIGQGIRFNEISGGELFAGRRWSDPSFDDTEWLTVRGATDGFRLVSNDATTEWLIYDEATGQVTINADLRVLGETTAAGLAPGGGFPWGTALGGAALALVIAQFGWNKRNRFRPAGPRPAAVVSA